MKTKIDTFIFDCFGVIYDDVLHGQYKENRIKYGLVDKNLDKAFQNYDLGNWSEDDIVEYFLKYKNINLTKKTS